jgi:hypothetical protein
VTKIFISYRRSDTKLIVGRIFDRLKEKFGRDSVFMDIDGIPLGVDFRAHLEREVSRAHAGLVLIGNGWGDTKDEHGQRRLDNPDDFVRIEIESMIKRNIPLVPVLIDGAPLPKPEQLPQSMQPLSYRNALQLDIVRDFEAHMVRLIADLERKFNGSTAVRLQSNKNGDRLVWEASTEEWERIKKRAKIRQLKRFAKHAHPYHAGLAKNLMRAKRWNPIRDLILTALMFILALSVLLIFGRR